MSDIFTKDKRSAVMASVRSTGNRATELAMIRVFRELRITGWRRGKRLRLEEHTTARNRKNETKLSRIIRPDFVFPERKIAVFVDGEFWHGHPTRGRIPATRREWWAAKIEWNRRRDRLQNRMLRKKGWVVVRIWQHELTGKHLHKALGKLRRAGITQSQDSAGGEHWAARISLLARNGSLAPAKSKKKDFRVIPVTTGQDVNLMDVLVQERREER